jgi:hypothetical protein
MRLDLALTFGFGLCSCTMCNALPRALASGLGRCADVLPVGATADRSALTWRIRTYRMRPLGSRWGFETKTQTSGSRQPLFMGIAVTGGINRVLHAAPPAGPSRARSAGLNCQCAIPHTTGCHWRPALHTWPETLTELHTKTEVWCRFVAGLAPCNHLSPPRQRSRN